MVKKVNLSQLKSKLRQIESRQRQAVNRYNQQVREHNQRINQSVRNANAAIYKYNQEVRAYTSRAKLNHQRLRSEIARLQSQSITRHVQYHQSVVRVTAAYDRLDQRTSNTLTTPQENFFVDLSEREAANTVGLFNALEAEGQGYLPEESVEPIETTDLQQTSIEDEVAVVSEELDSRWRGALFALHPKNPEAARHFCTSVRELFTEILELKAPDQLVFSAMPECARTQHGNATRRSKIEYLLSLKSIRNPELSEFVDEDVSNVIELFDVLNGATHGASGRLTLSTLRQVKRRVEDALLFLCRFLV